MKYVLELNVFQQPVYFLMFKCCPLIRKQKLYFLSSLFIVLWKEKRKYKNMNCFWFANLPYLIMWQKNPVALRLGTL